MNDYLRNNYEPEMEFVEATLHAKPIGTREHMRMERRLERLLESYEASGLGETLHEISVRHGNDVRIPDLAFVAAGARFDNGILMDPPLLCVEILSPSQRPAELFAKCKAYHAWGVPYCWVIDPLAKVAWEFHAGSSPQEIATAALHAGTIVVSIETLFA